jgi:hypothetical protein
MSKWPANDNQNDQPKMLGKKYKNHSPRIAIPGQFEMHTTQILSVEYILIYFHAYIEVHQSGAKVNRDKRAIACFACKRISKFQLTKDNGLPRLGRMSISNSGSYYTLTLTLNASTLNVCVTY